uniref:Uncharacterized protein MANES_02G008100 n=1 Tax=Rhizophora mucronata TaxID=61149 RepID=A0A2P2JC23_RHIMU
MMPPFELRFGCWLAICNFVTVLWAFVYASALCGFNGLMLNVSDHPEVQTAFCI